MNEISSDRRTGSMGYDKNALNVERKSQIGLKYVQAVVIR